MCGRFVLNVDPAVLQSTFDLGTVPEFGARFNIAPTQTVPIILNEAPPDVIGTPAARTAQPIRQAMMVRWGLIPSWAKEMSMGSKLINARAETVDEKPAFRQAFKRRRCIAPASGYYEWKETDDGKQPFYIHRVDDSLIGFAGLWEIWQSPEGEEVRTFCIMTTEANTFASQIHHRMPVILRPEDYDRWLNTPEKSASDLKPLLKPYADENAFIAHPVSKVVNKPGVDLPNLIEPIH